MRRLRPPFHFDTTAADVLHALKSCIKPPSEDDRMGLEDLIAWRWKHGDKQATGISVRSLFDAYLECRSETGYGDDEANVVLVSAINHPHMFEILSHHGYDVVPVDIDLDTLSMTVEDLEDKLKEYDGQVFGVLSADLMGGKCDHRNLAEVAHDYGALYWVDSAQSLRHIGEWGPVEADAVFWSLGPFKTATAFGGGIARFADEQVAKWVRNFIRNLPMQPVSTFAKRAILLGALLPLDDPYFYSAFDAACQLLRVSAKQALTDALRSHKGPMFIESLRQAPSMPLLAQMAHVSAENHVRSTRLRTDSGQRISAMVHEWERTDRSPALAGWGQTDRTYWMLWDRHGSLELRKACREAGWDLVRDISSLSAHPAASQEMIAAASRMQLIPVFPDAVADEEARLARALSRTQLVDEPVELPPGMVMGMAALAAGILMLKHFASS